jgi:DNA-binding MltR family transcriptional regulator
MIEEGYELIPAGANPISKSGIQDILNQIRPVWKGKDLIQRVERLLPVDASSACQRLFNAAIHDLKEKIIVIGVDLAKEVAVNYKLPPLSKDEDVLDYNVSKTIDLAYRIGILTRPEWRRIHRCYEIRRDLEHEDNEYEAVLEDCFYIFKSTIDIVLSKDPIELLKVTDAKELIEKSNKVTPSEEFLEDFKSAPRLRQKEIFDLLISYAYDSKKPDIIRENSVELMRQIRPITNNTVTIEIASDLENRLGRNAIDLITAKISHACGAIGYFKQVKLRDFYGSILEEFKTASSDWDKQTAICSKLEDVGGLKNCPNEIYFDILKKMIEFYIGEPSYGQYRNLRPVFFSNGAAPIITRIIQSDPKTVGTYIDKLRNDKEIRLAIGNTYILRRFEYLVDFTEIE